MRRKTWLGGACLTILTLTASDALAGGSANAMTSRRFDDAAARTSLRKDASALGVRHDRELGASHVHVDALDMTHVRSDRLVRGIPVVGGEISAHYDRHGALRAVRGREMAGLDQVDTVSALTAEDAIARADAARIGGKAEAAPRLVVFAVDSTPALAWEVTVRGDALASTLVTIDAHTGAVLNAMTQAEEILGSGVGVSGQRRAVEYVERDGMNVMEDGSRADATTTVDLAGGRDVAKGANVVSSDPTSWDRTSPQAPGAAVDAQALLAQASGYFTTTFGRKGWDDANGPLKILVHVGDVDGNPGLDGAFLYESLGALAIGDGRSQLNPLAGHLDVLAHEYTHAITARSSRLRYDGESGALNESMSDVFAAVIEHSFAPDPARNWRIGEGTVKGDASAAMRDLAAPERSLTPQPSHVRHRVRTSADNGGVHANSGIPNKAAYLMTVGGTSLVSGITIHHGIGWENLAKVWYRANTVYLTETATFADAASATRLAAEDLGLSSADLETIDCAWKAVGVLPGECAADVSSYGPPEDDAAEDGGCSTIAGPRGASFGPLLVGFVLAVLRRRRSSSVER